jgi:hypothetical protein
VLPPVEETDCGPPDERWMLLDCSDDVSGTACGRALVSVVVARDVLVRVSRHSLERDDPAPGPYVLQLGVE